MNAFRILSRSTNISRNKQKSSHTTATSSTERASGPRILSNNEGPAIKKQKREDTSATVDADLDFFKTIDGTNSSTGKATSLPKERTNPSKLAQATPVDQEEDSAQEPHLDEAESRKLLKAHKIKVTCLWQASPAEDEKKRKKRKRKDVETDQASEAKRQKQDLNVQPLTNFSRLATRYNVHRRIAENLAAQGYTVPTEIQIGSLPLLLGKSGCAALPDSQPIDLLSVAPTGSGKTLAFLIPVLNSIKHRRQERVGKPDGPEAFIVAPTKELASQIVNEARKLAQNTGIKVTLLKKGMKLEGIQAARDEEESDAEDDDEDDQSEDERRPKHSIVKSSVLVSTPGTMLQALTSNDGTVRETSSVRHVVLDEADVLLDPLFRDQTMAIWDACSNPELRLTLWSATMGASIEDLAKTKLAERRGQLPLDPKSAHTRAPLMRIVVGLKDSAVPNIHHKMIYAASEQGKLLGLRQLLRPTAASTDAGPRLRPPFIVFTQTIERAVALHSELKFDIPAEAGGSNRIAVLHSDLSETARDKIMTRFRKGEIWVLITTDLLSRGVDFRGVNGVVNYDFPNSSAAYIHRVGRTGRAGREGGVAVTLYAEEDIPYVKNVANVIAAAERLQSGGELDNMTRWLVESLPKINKQDKKKLKRHGVESRRPAKHRDGEDGRANHKHRISTKSGFERREQNNRRGAIEASKGRGQMKAAEDGNVESGSETEFGGFD